MTDKNKLFMDALNHWLKHTLPLCEENALHPFGIKEPLNPRRQQSLIKSLILSEIVKKAKKGGFSKEQYNTLSDKLSFLEYKLNQETQQRHMTSLNISTSQTPSGWEFSIGKKVKLRELFKKEHSHRCKNVNQDLECLLKEVGFPVKPPQQIRNFSAYNLRKQRLSKDQRTLTDKIYSQNQLPSYIKFFVGRTSDDYVIAYSRAKPVKTIVSKAVTSYCEYETDRIAGQYRLQKLNDARAATIVVTDDKMRELLWKRICKSKRFIPVEKSGVKNEPTYSAFEYNKRVLHLINKSSHPKKHDFDRYFHEILVKEEGVPLTALGEMMTQLPRLTGITPEIKDVGDIRYNIFDENTDNRFSVFPGVSIQIDNTRLYDAFEALCDDAKTIRTFTETDPTFKPESLKNAAKRLRAYGGFRDQKTYLEDTFNPNKVWTEVRIVTFKEELGNLDPNADTSRNTYEKLHFKI